MGAATALASTHPPHAHEGGVPYIRVGGDQDAGQDIRQATPGEIRAAVLGRLQHGQKCPTCGGEGAVRHPYTHLVVDCEPCDATGYLPLREGGACA